MEGIVYAICSKRHDLMYVGCTQDFVSRIKCHVSQILNGTHPHSGMKVHFAGHDRADLFCKILQRVDLSQLKSPWDKRQALRTAETKWIRALKCVNGPRRLVSRHDIGIDVVDVSEHKQTPAKQ